MNPTERMNDRELMRIHVEALFTRDAAGRLLRVNEPNGAREQAHSAAARTAQRRSR
jgi:hypothetical protein